jgi:hypothetical protein
MWREATIISRLDPDHWRAEYPGGGSSMFREADIRAYDARRCDHVPRAKATVAQVGSAALPHRPRHLARTDEPLPGGQIGSAKLAFDNAAVKPR